MPRRLVPNYCEQCGRRYELIQPKPGENDLGLDQIKSAFRYCSACQRFVGRSCCWNSEVLACTRGEPGGVPHAAPSPADLGARKKIAIRRLADLAESVDDLRHAADVIDSSITSGVAISPRTWEDAFWATGWVIARADTSRDSVARALWPPPPPEPAPSRRSAVGAPSGGRFEELHEQLADLMKGYLAARAAVEERLVAAARPLDVDAAGPTNDSFWRGRGRGRQLVFGGLLGAAVAVVVVVVGGSAILGGRAPEMGILGGQGTPDQTGGTGGGAGEPQASAATPAPTVASNVPARSVRANLDFDMLRVGALQGASEAFTDMVGVNDVVPFPSPFDRSVRMLGSGAHRFCVSVPGLEAREAWVAVDLYAGSLPFGSFELAAVPADGAATAIGIPSELVTSLLPGRWYRLGARWQPGMPVTIEIRDAQGGELISEPARVSVAAPAETIDGLCLSASGMASDGELLLDNLRVEQ